MEYSLIKSRVMGNLETTGFDTGPDIGSVSYAFNIVLFALYAAYLVRRERIDLGAMLRAFLHR